MSTDTDLIKLYSAQILALTTDIPFTDRLVDPDASAKKRSPLCGSSITVDVNVVNSLVSGFGQDVKACALGQAAAAIVGKSIIGRSLAELQTARAQLTAMLKENGQIPDAPFDGLEVLIPARDYKNRHASILLALDASVEAMQTATQQATA